MGRRAFAHLMIVAALTALASCAKQPPLVPAAADAARTDESKQRSDHLLTPEGSDDLAKLDDAALAARVAAQRAEADARTGAAFRFALAYTGGDLSGDSAYRSLLFDMKQAETELARLEREQQRRKPPAKPNSPRPGGPSPAAPTQP